MANIVASANHPVACPPSNGSWERIEYDVMMMGSLPEDEFCQRDRSYDFLGDSDPEEDHGPLDERTMFMVDVRTGREFYPGGRRR
jgi:hypothetical protein